MPFSKGDPNIYKGGRKKGSKNTIPLAIRSHIRGFIADNKVRFQEEINTLKGKDFITAYLMLLPFAIGKMQPKESTISIDNLSEADCDVLYDYIIEKMNENEK